MTYSPPSHPLEVLQKLNFDEAVGPEDPRFVDLDAARGGVGIQASLARKFGLDLTKDIFYPNQKRHVLLFGPIGCGKSTELLRFAATLEKGKRIMPVLLNVRGEIDINNLQYADVLMALARALVVSFEKKGLDIPAEKLTLLKNWFSEQVVTEEKIRDLTAELKSEASIGPEIPFLARLLSKLTTAFKTSSVYKDALREVVKKSFTQFAQAFNQLVGAAEEVLVKNGIAERLLLIVDGTDKIPLDDSMRLFVHESEQLLAIQSLILYTAPITLKYGGSGISKVNTDEVLPIVKLVERDGTRHEAGWKAMEEMLDRRIDPATFSDPTLRDRLIEYSGGHPRELLRLLRMACELAESDRIEATTVEKAIDKLAADYRYWLQPDDYELLARIDESRGANMGNDERTRNLLWRLALLHYNDGSWRSTHPAVRRLEGYQKALKNIPSA